MKFERVIKINNMYKKTSYSEEKISKMESVLIGLCELEDPPSLMQIEKEYSIDQHILKKHFARYCEIIKLKRKQYRQNKKSEFINNIKDTTLNFYSEKGYIDINSVYKELNYNYYLYDDIEVYEEIKRVKHEIIEKHKMSYDKNRKHKMSSSIHKN